MQGIRVGIQKVGTQFDICLLNISGYVDTTTCQELTQTIQALTDQKNILFITDLGGVTYISSAGWGVFMGEIKGIREKGGDIKIVHMNPEVFEVFEMLEFNRILNYYDSVEEAINEFDLLRGFDITHSLERPPETDASLEISQETNQAPVLSQEMTVSDFPLVEKIKRIIIENPFFSLQDIQSELNTSNYGYVRIHWWKLRSLLKSLSLETKEKRYRFYRSR
jgi:anti-anti-sigma factor